jgi:hypothetical protein
MRQNIANMAVDAKFANILLEGKGWARTAFSFSFTRPTYFCAHARWTN